MVGLIISAAVAITIPVAVGLVWRRARQRRVAKALTITTPNGIVEERYVRLGGVDQWVLIRGEDRDNPVLVVLHGGPGWPNAVFTPVLRAWERHFTVVQWDHRGVGKSRRRNGAPTPGEMTFDQRVDDAVELVQFLRRHLHTDTVVLLAESMGTLTGTALVRRRPDLFSAYVVTDLYVDMVRNEADKYKLTLDRLRAAGKTKAIGALQRIGGDPTRWDLRAWNTNMAWAFRTNTPTANLDRRLLLPLALSSPLYSLRDLYHLIVGFSDATRQMFDQIIAYDARRLGTRFDVPVLVVQGDSDVITLTTLAGEYVDDVDAPDKRMALIADAGHFAAFTHPDAFLAELLAFTHTVCADAAAQPHGAQLRSAQRDATGSQH